MKAPKIIFLEIITNQQKITALCQLAQSYFDQKDAVLILAPSVQALHYIDELLWKYPDDSFLPHETASSPSKEKVVITTHQQNLNQAKVLINLSPQPPLFLDGFETIYELYDKTHPDKSKQSEKRYQEYLKKGLNVIIRQ